eukprot:145882-Pleurochrysis_carterae.AAC.5
MPSSILEKGKQASSKSFMCMTVASTTRESGTWPVERRRRDGGPDADAVEVTAKHGLLRKLHVNLLRYRGQAVARSERHRPTSDALDFGENRLVKRDVAEADGSEPVDVEQVDEVAAAALIVAKVNAFCNSRCGLAWLLYFAAKATGCAAEKRAELVNARMRAGLYHLGRLVRDSGSAPSDKG